MPHEGDKRRDPRVPLVLRVEYPGSPEALRDVTENLSTGGLLIRTGRPLAVGDRLALEIGFPGLLAPLELEVEVVRVRPPSGSDPGGVAVKIPVDHVDDRHKLAALVETARAPGRATRGWRVLVVEDNPHVIEMYQYALRKLADEAAGLVVEYATNGHEALARLGRAPRVDLVLTDVYMPVLGGLALIERIRGDAEIEGIPILVVSAAGPDAKARALELGADVYLQKPVQFGDIIGTVRTLLRIPAR